MLKRMATIIGSAAMAFSIPVLVSCSKKEPEDSAVPGEKQPEAMGSSKETAYGPAAGGPGKQATAKVAERSTTIRDQRIKSVVQSLDQLEVQRRKLEVAEEEARAKLNGIRGVPADTEVDISNPGIAGDRSKEEREAFEAYLMVAWELQTLDAKEMLFNQQLERSRAMEE